VSIAVGSFERSSDVVITSVEGAADVGGTYVGEPLRVGRFSEQVWGDSDERDQYLLTALEVICT
jgi:hypothetical protein